MTTAEQIKFDKAKRKNSQAADDGLQDENFDEQVYINERQQAKQFLEMQKKVKKQKFE